jgi:uncharacterized repeat protein (TIGR03943 family)
VSVEGRLVPPVIVTALLLRLGLSDDLLIYLKPSMRLWLLVAAVALGTVTLGWLAAHWWGSARDGTEDGHDGHDHGTGRLRWLLLLPYAVVFVVPPEPLGAFAASREGAQPTPPPMAGSGGYPPLPAAVDGAHELRLSEFVSYARDDPERRLEGRVVRLTGFVTPAGEGEVGFRLTRFVLACCAGDGRAVSVAIRGADRPLPPPDTWLVVEGRWRPAPSGNEPEVPVLEARSVREVPQPVDPYETW